jgi:hypothetical protein
LTCSQPRLSIFGCIHPHKVSYEWQFQKKLKV